MTHQTSPTLFLPGGDLRMQYAAAALSEKGYTVIPAKTLADLLPRLTAPAAILLPYPLRLSPSTLSETLEALDNLREKPLLLAPSASDRDIAEAARKNIPLRLYGQEETFLQEGAILTAKGLIPALRRALDLPHLSGLSVLVTGYGRVAKAVAHALREQGSTVTVLCRKDKARLQAETDGFTALPLQPLPAELLRSADFLCGTVPAPLFSAQDLTDFSGIYLELASPPGGLLPGALPEDRILRLPGIPGAYLPKESGESLANAVLCCLQKGGEPPC